MNRIYNHVSSSTRFASSCTDACEKLLNRIQRAKNQLLAEFRPGINPHQRMLQLALNEAEGLACQTGFPLLVFPTLAREKAEAVTAWRLRQESIRGLQSFAA
jgi:hypothetical protein